MKQIQISVVILCHQLDDQLKAAADSVAQADELLLIDNSNDEKIEAWVEKKLKLAVGLVKIVKWSGKITSFSKVRNFAIKQAKYDWILMLDSDEILASPQKSFKFLREIGAKSQAAAFKVIRQDEFKDKMIKFGEAGKIWLIRFFHKKAGVFERRVHEVFKPELKVGCKKINLKILHNSHQNISSFIQTVSSYAQTEAKNRWQSCSKSRLYLVKLVIKLLTFPLAKLVHNLIFKLGILDGWRGLVYGSIMSLHSALVRIYQLELAIDKEREIKS